MCIFLYFFNPYPAKLKNLNFQPLEVVRRYRDPQLQVAGNYWYLFNYLSVTLFLCFSIIFAVFLSPLYASPSLFNAFPSLFNACDLK